MPSNCLSVFDHSVGLVLKVLNLKRKDDVLQYLKYNTMVKGNTFLFKVAGLIRETINPFTQDKEVHSLILQQEK